MVSLRLVYTPRVRRDLDSIHPRDVARILIDIELLTSPPWPAGKTKPLRGHSFWEMKCGDFRVLFQRQGEDVYILRVVNRRDLDRALGR